MGGYLTLVFLFDFIFVNFEEDWISEYLRSWSNFDFILDNFNNNSFLIFVFLLVSLVFLSNIECNFVLIFLFKQLLQCFLIVDLGSFLSLLLFLFFSFCLGGVVEID